MAQLPADFAGGFQLLIERLESGTALKADQEWAARLLRGAERAIGAKARRAYVDTTEARDQRIYLEVCAELASAADDDVKRACAAVAERFRVRRERVDSGAMEMHPPMHPATVEKIYEEQRRLEATLADWRRQTPLMQAISAEEHGALNRMRLERGQGEHLPPVAPWAPPDGAQAAAEAAVLEWLAENAKCAD